MGAGVWLSFIIIMALGFALMWGLFRLLRPAKGPLMVCTTCGHLGRAVQITKGSLGVEIVMWIAFLLPGVVYSIWRLVTRKSGCAECRGTALVPPTSPVGKRMLAEAEMAAQGQARGPA
jgi:hypothetical protein